jgi:hypothetical protein
MHLSSQNSHHCSWCVVIRLGLKLAVFSVVCGFQMALGYPSVFFHLTTLAALLCIVLALQARELPLSRSLNHWDEALLLGLISYLGNGVLALG